MAGDLNRITLIGRLTRDPELKYIQSGSAVANFSVANNRVFVTGNGEKKEEVNFFDCIAWGKLGEIIVEYCKKGKRLAIEGRLQQNRWEDKEGNKKSRIEIIAENVQFLDGKADNQHVSSSSNEEVPQHSGASDNPFSDDNIPF